MADIIDKANELADLHLRVALRNQRAGAKTATSTEGIGMCLHCSEPVEGDRRWCDTDCRDEYQREQQRRG